MNPGDALKDALKKLVGLDLLAKLDIDLGIVVRQLSDRELPKSVREKKERLDLEILNLEKRKNEGLQKVDSFRNQLIDLTEKIDRAEEKLRQKGGVWASTRHKDQEVTTQLVARKTMLEGNIKKAARRCLSTGISTCGFGEFTSPIVCRTRSAIHGYSARDCVGSARTSSKFG